MKQYKATFVCPDASGYVHHYSRGLVWATSETNALDQLNKQFGIAENEAFYKLELVIA